MLGGNLNEVTLGLNWFPIQNIKIQLQAIMDQRTGLFPVDAQALGSGLTATAQPIYGDRGFSSWVSGVGLRFGLDY